MGVFRSRVATAIIGRKFGEQTLKPARRHVDFVYCWLA